MEKKNLLIFSAVIVILIIIGVGIFINSSRSKETDNQNTTVDQTIQTLSPAEIGLKLVLSNNKQKVRVNVEKITDIKTLEYDISYDSDIPVSELAPGEEGGKVERGFSDEAIITSGMTKYESKEFDLGSCSRNVCRYDTGVEEVRIEIKVVKKDGKIYQVKDSIKL